jgi:FG-GAP-like repeat
MFATSLSRFRQRDWPVPRTRRWPYPRRPACRLWLERLEDRTLLNGHPALDAALPIDLRGSVAENLRTPGEVDSFQLTLPASGRLNVQVQPAPAGSLSTRLSLLGPDGQLLIQSDGQSATVPGDSITQDLLPGKFFLQLTGLGGGTGTYTLTTDFQPATAPQQSVAVDYQHNFPTGVTPRFSAEGDFNGDGHLDIVTANTATNDVSLLLGLGDGTFQTARNFAAGTRPVGVAAGDFNGDGKLDLAVANQGSGDVSILLGRGDGTFAPEMRFPGGDGAWGIATADLNGDGKLDLVIANTSTDDVSVLLGNGDGTFQPEMRFLTSPDPNNPGRTPQRPVIADFNGDGHPDIAVVDFGSSAISVLLGNGDGTFQPEVPIPVGASPLGLVAGYFNSDRHLDLAVANGGDDNVSILLGNGDGTFTEMKDSDGKPLRPRAGSTPDTLATADFNHDGHFDLAISNRESNDVSVLLGRGDGTFEEQKRYRAGIEPFAIYAGDFNEDGRLDLATVNAESHDASILLGLGDGTFQPDLSDPRPQETGPSGLVARDFNGDGILDLATTSYTGHVLYVYLGRGDGTFEKAVQYPVGSTPNGIVSADFNGDGIPDLATANCNSGDVSILLGRGDGTFRDQLRFPSSQSTEFIVAGDFNGDGQVDLVTGGQFFASGGVVLLGNGDGTFQPRKTFALGYALGDVAIAGDFNGDGKLDLAATDFLSPTGDVLIFRGKGDGTFQPPLRIPVGFQPLDLSGQRLRDLGLAAGDFNGDGKLDLAVANTGSNSVSILLGNGDGTFQDPVRYATGFAPDSIVAAALSGRHYANGQPILDLAVSNSRGTDVSVLRGNGDGTFQDQVPFPVGDHPTPRSELLAGDFNGDGKLDLAVTEVSGSDISVLLGSGDGSFQKPLRFPVGLGPVAVTTGDFHNDGRLGVASVNPTTNEVSVSLGRGDTTLEAPVRFAVGLAPVAVAADDFNRDGRLDLATANFGSNDVSVLLGLGDGTFRPEQRYAVGTNPVALATGDFSGDGILDLAVANAGSNDVSILFGRGDGTFGDEIRLAAGDLPQALVVGDFNGDGIFDLAVANYRSQDVWVYLGRGDGTFQEPLKIPLGESPVALVAGDFNGDSILDVATADYRSGNVSVLLGRGDGTFQCPMRFPTGNHPASLVTGDFDGDGDLDLVAADSASQDMTPGQGQGYGSMGYGSMAAAHASYDVTLLMGNGDGTFALPMQRQLDDSPGALAAADFNSDGRLDLAIAGQFSSDVSILQGLGSGMFVPGGMIANPLRSTPLVADFNGDGLPDVAEVSRQGEILLRLARPGAPRTFEAPVVVNPDPKFAARDLAVVTTRRGLLLAALDAKKPSLSFYARRRDGTFTRSPGPALEEDDLPVALAAGDLNGDGLTDLVVVEGCGEVFVYLQNAAGGFGPTPDYQLHVGMSPSAVELVDVDGDGRPGIVVTNQYSGDISVLRNLAGGGFAPELRFRAGTGLFSVGNSMDKLAVGSRLAPAGLVAGKFDTSDAVDLIVTNSGANRFSLLRGDGAGGFFNAEQMPNFATGIRPTAVVAGRFTNNANDPLDLAILNEESGDLSIFLGDGHGGFSEKVRLSAGYLPTGLAAYDINGDGKLDLLVGNDFGDLLILLGNGDGTFQIYRRAERKVALAVADLTGKGTDDIIFADQSLDRVTVQYAEPGQSFEKDRTDGLLAPGAIKVADLNGDGIPDLVVANSGGEDVRVYLGLGNGTFGPAHIFPTGTNPASVTIAFLNDDTIPDPTDPTQQRQIDPTPDLVVANEGSNDVTIWLGRGQGKDWTLDPGPRLKARGSGPVSTALRSVPNPKGGAPTQDLLVANSQSNTVTLLPGAGRGFFDDQKQSVQTFPTGTDPQQVLVDPFRSKNQLDMVTVNAGSNDLTFFPNFGAAQSIGTGGNTPLAAVAADLNHDGIMDLLVANNGDGGISLLLGSASGLTLAKVFSRADVTHPTDVALGDDPSVFYVSQEGEETAARFTLDLGLGLATSPGPARIIAGLLPLQDSAPATVATLLTVAGEHELPGAERALALEPTLAIGLIVALASSGEADYEDREASSPHEDLMQLSGSSNPSRDLAGLVIGLEEALERAGMKLRQRLLETDKRPMPITDLDAFFKETISAQQAVVSAMSAPWQLLEDSLVNLVQPVAAVLRSAVQTCELKDVPLPNRVWSDVAEAVLQSGRAITRGTADVLRSLLPAENGSSAPAGPEQTEIPQQEMKEDGKNQTSQRDSSGDPLPALERRSVGMEALAMPLVAAFFATYTGPSSRTGWQKGRQRLRRRAL